MGCFIACFGSSKQRKSRRHLSPNPQIHEHFEPAAKSIITPISQPIDVSEKQSNPCIGKKVQFNSDVNISKEEVQKCIVGIEEENEGEKVVKQEAVNQQITKFSQENEEKNREKEETQTLSDSSMSSYISYPPMHRYHNCTITDNDDDEFEDINSKESSDSLFSLSFESRKQASIIETGEKEEVSSPLKILTPVDGDINSIDFNQNCRDKSQSIHSVLNPTENLNQWKEVISRTNPLTLNHHHDEKENLNSEQELNVPFCEEPTLKSSSNQNSKQKFSNLRPKVVQEIEVDTSLSSWLVGSGKTPMSEESSNSVGDLLSSSSQTRRGNSCTSLVERPVLVELSVEELKHLSACLTPKRKSPSCSRDEVAILGTIESYLNHTGQTMDSCSSSSSKAKSSGTPTKLDEDKRVKCNSTPFATRLERSSDVEIA